MYSKNNTGSFGKEGVYLLALLILYSQAQAHFRQIAVDIKLLYH